MPVITTPPYRPITGFSVLSTAPMAWYDFSNPLNYTLLSGAVSAATDLSGSGRHLTQASAGNRPSISSINGLGALNLGGASKRLTSSVFAAKTVMFAFQFNTTASDNERIYVASPSSGTGRILYYEPSNGTINFFPSASYAINGDVVSSSAGAFSNAGFSNNINVGYNVSDTTWSVAVPLGYNAGFTVSGLPRVGEILFFDYVLTAQERTDVEVYLANKWGATLV